MPLILNYDVNRFAPAPVSLLLLLLLCNQRRLIKLLSPIADADADAPAVLLIDLEFGA